MHKTKKNKIQLTYVIVVFCTQTQLKKSVYPSNPIHALCKWTQKGWASVWYSAYTTSENECIHIFTSYNPLEYMLSCPVFCNILSKKKFLSSIFCIMFCLMLKIIIKLAFICLPLNDGSKIYKT